MAQLLDKESVPSTNSLVELFSVPPTQTVIDHSYWYPAHPVNTITSDGPYQFRVDAGPEYLQLGRNFMYMKLIITKADGTDVVDTDKVAPINLLGKTLFKQVRVDINGKLVYDSGSMYAYRAFLETELNYNSDCKTSFLGPGGYVKSGSTPDSEHDEGFKHRQAQYVTSKAVELMAPLHCDLFSSDRLMISNTQIVLELHRNNDQFALMSFSQNPTFKIQVMDMIWYVKKLVVSPTVHIGIESALTRRPAKYPLRRVAMTKVHISDGRFSVPTNSVFDGQIPRRVIIGFVASDAYFGSYKKSPFVFGNAGVKEIAVHAGGHVYPREPFKMDFDVSHCVRPYLSLFDTLGLLDDNKSNDITFDDYKTNHCLFAFDLTPDDSDSTHWELIREGSTSVHCTFKEPVNATGLEMIVYAEFDNLAMIDRNRTVYFDFTV